jgi:hypothetical protein
MGWAHNTHVGDNECVHSLGWKVRMEEITCKNQGIDSRIILKLILREIRFAGVE